MWHNRHVIVALLVCPLLALLGWYGVDRLLAEQPHAARAGAVYSLLAKSNCRYASGRCDLVNGDLRLALSPLTKRGSALQIDASLPLQGVVLAVGDAAPSPMQRADAAGRLWRLPLAALPPPDAPLRLVALAGDSRFTSELSSVFLRRDPGPGGLSR